MNFCYAECLCLLQKPTKLSARPLSRNPLTTIVPHYFPGEGSSCFVFLKDIVNSAGPMRREKSKAKGGKSAPLQMQVGDRDARLPLRRSVTVGNSDFFYNACILYLFIHNSYCLAEEE